MKISVEFTDGSMAVIEGDDIGVVVLSHGGSIDTSQGGMKVHRTDLKIHRLGDDDASRWELADADAEPAKPADPPSASLYPEAPTPPPVDDHVTVAS